MSDNRKRHDYRRRSRSRSPYRRERKDSYEYPADASKDGGDRDRDRHSRNRDRDYDIKDYRSHHRSNNRQTSRDRDKSSRDRERDSRIYDQNSKVHNNSRDRHHNNRSPPLQRNNRYDDQRNTHQSLIKNSLLTNHQLYENSPRSSYSGSPYSTPPPPPPSVPPSKNKQQLSHSSYTNTYNERLNYSTDNRDSRHVNVPLNHKVRKPEIKLQNFKLLIDPTIKKGHTVKVLRYDGILTGQPPVTPKDPRRQKSKIWSIEVCDLPVPEFKIDKNYVGSMLLDTVRFSGLNDNIDRKFLHELCEAYGDIKEHKVYFDPSTNRHLGTGKVVFDEHTRIAKVIAALDGRQIMGQNITVFAEKKNPPGQAMLKQLENECLQYRTKENLLSDPTKPFQNINQSVTQPTPGTPPISSLHRNHPIASGITNETFSSKLGVKPPPPPPLPTKPLEKNTYVQQHLNNLPPPPMSMKFEDISPTVDKAMWSSRNNKGFPMVDVKKQTDFNSASNPLTRTRNMLNHMGTYSPVSNSDRSASPVSPSIRDMTPADKLDKKFIQFDNASDISNSLHVEDISPDNSPHNKNPELKRTASVDDDAMSLSSISSNEEKLEIFDPNMNHQNNSKVAATPTYMQPLNSLPSQYPLPPPISMFPTLPHVVPQCTPSLLQSQTNQNFQTLLPQFTPSSRYSINNQNVSNSSNLQQTNLPEGNVFPNINLNVSNKSLNINWPRNFTDRNTEIIKNALLSSNNNSTPQLPLGGMPPNQLPLQLLNQMQPQLPIQLPQSVPINGPPLPRPPPQLIPPNSSHISTHPTLVSKELQFLFSVKTGCARELSQELKLILKKDTLKKLIEQTAFQSFENWWEKNSLKKDLKSSLYLDSSLKNENKSLLDKTKENKTLLDKSNKMLKPIATVKEATLTTSALLQTLFGRDQNIENRPPTAASFLNSFRISRKPQQIQSSMKGSYISRKRKPWPLLNQNKMKQRRIEDSEDEDNNESEEDSENEIEDSDEDDEEQFEQFALRQRQVKRSGSSLYQQKIYSDDSEDEKTQSEADSSSSDQSSDESTTSTDSDTTESEREPQVKNKSFTKELPTIKEIKEDEDKDSSSAEVSQEFKSSVEKQKSESFVSMYDEPRRKHSTVYNHKKEHKKKSLQIKKNLSKIIRQRTKKVPVQIYESSDTESADERELVNHVLTEKENHQANKSQLATKTEKEDSLSEQEMLRNLILLEHNYFLPSKPFKSKIRRKVLYEKNINNQDRKHDDVNNEIDVIKTELSSIKFPLRTKKEENDILKDLYKGEIDLEDIQYFKNAFDKLKESDAANVDITALTWANHPITTLPPVKQKRQKAETKLRVHNSGSARSEGFYKIPMVEKATYLKSALRQLNLNKQNEITKKNPAGTEHKIKSRENRAMQRRLASSIAEEYGSLLNFNSKLKIRKKALRFAKSSIHNWGLFACEPIAAEEMVCEYVGQMVRAVVAEIREKRYEMMGIGSSYLFRLDMESVIDATKHGCSARFINHCCDPNCYAKVILVEGAKKIVIYSRRDIKINEEITYDYKFPIEDEKIPCLCGAAACRGSLN